MIESYEDELRRAVRTRGRTRAPFLSECHEHLVDLAAERGEQQAVACFGDPAAIAAAFDLEVTAARTARGAWSTVVGVLATGGSTLALIYAADADADAAVPAPAAWAIVFFLAAQIAIVSVVIVALQALRLRRAVDGPADVALLARRSAICLVSAAITMFAAGAAQPGNGSTVQLLAGPVLGCGAGIVVLRAWVGGRRLGANDDEPARQSPFSDIRRLTGFQIPTVGPVPIAIFAALAAIVRDGGEVGSTTIGSAKIGAVEGALVLVAYVCLRSRLGLGVEAEPSAG